MSRIARCAWTTAALLPVALCVGCFDSPVQNTLQILFGADGTVEIHAGIVIRAVWKETDQAPVRDRIDGIRDTILHGEDLWARAFRAMEPRRERLIYDYQDGLLSGATRMAIVDTPSAIEKLFAETRVSAFVETENRTMTLELVPGAGNDTTERQERRVARALDRFSEAVATHMETLAELYEWLEKNPDEAAWALGSLIGVHREDGAGLVTEEGRRLVRMADKSGDSLIEVLEMKEQDAFTLDELSRLVHDPFPSPVVIEVEGEVLETRGFRVEGARRFVTRSHSLWEGLAALHGRWVEPLPLVELVAALREEGDGVELDEESLLSALVTRPRAVHHLPDAAEVKDALMRELTPPDLYLLRWTLPSESGD